MPINFHIRRDMTTSDDSVFLGVSTLTTEYQTNPGTTNRRTYMTASALLKTALI
jgi:hypothetical protein